MTLVRRCSTERKKWEHDSVDKGFALEPFVLRNILVEMIKVEKMTSTFILTDTRKRNSVTFFILFFFFFYKHVNFHYKDNDTMREKGIESSKPVASKGS